MADLVQYYGTGRRKSAIARVFLRPGTGEWKVNDKGFEEYFVTEQQRVSAKRTLALVELSASFNVLTTVAGGGVAAQADAVKHADFIQSITSHNFHNQVGMGAESALTAMLGRTAAYTGKETTWAEVMESTEVWDPGIDIDKLG